MITHNHNHNRIIAGPLAQLGSRSLRIEARRGVEVHIPMRASPPTNQWDIYSQARTFSMRAFAAPRLDPNQNAKAARKSENERSKMVRGASARAERGSPSELDGQPESGFEAERFAFETNQQL
jgi:hypothetical protein